MVIMTESKNNSSSNINAENIKTKPVILPSKPPPFPPDRDCFKKDSID